MKSNCVSFGIVLACLSSCHGFFWNTQPEVETQQKAFPLNYFRTYSYHPLTVHTPPTSFRLVPTANSAFTPQIAAKSSATGSFTAQSILAPTNIVAQMTTTQQTANPLPSPPSAPAAPVTTQAQNQQIPEMTGYQNTVQSHAPQMTHQGLREQQPLSGFPQQHAQQRQYPAYNENGFQYIPPPPQYNLQQVQFVPCMCPVTLSLNPEPFSNPFSPEKRADEAVSTNVLESQSQQMIEANTEVKFK